MINNSFGSNFKEIVLIYQINPFTYPYKHKRKLNEMQMNS